MKRSSRKKRLAKWSKLGLSLAAVTVLGGVVEPGGADFVSPKVYAETYVNTSDQPIGVVVYYSGQNLDGTKVNLEGWESYIEVQPGQEIAAPKEFEGYTLISTSYTPPVFSDGALLYVYSQNESIEQPKLEEPAGDTTSTDTPSEPQPTSSQPTVEDRYDVVTLKYRDENGEDLGEDLMMVYPTSPQRITPPAIEGYEFKEASVGENYLMYSKPISLPYEHRFAQVLTEEDLNNHSNFLGGKIKEAQDSLRDGSAYTYILNYRKTSPSEQAPQTKRVRFIIDVKPDVVTGTSSFDGFSRRYVYLHPGESYTFPIDESRFEIRPNQKLTYSYDEVEAGKDYSISVRPKAVTSQPTDKPVEAPANRPAETPTNVQTNANPAGQSASEKQETKEQESSKLTSQYSYKDIPGTSSSVTVRVHGQDVGKVASLSVKKENDPAVIAKLPQALAEQQVDLYDIKTLDATGQFVQVTEDALVTLPVAAGKEVDKVIYFLASTGAVEELPFTVDKATNQVSFTVSHFSHYGIVYQANKPVSQAQSGSTGQSAPGKQETKQEAKEQAAPASPSKQATAKSAPTSQPQAKSLPATGEAHSVLHMTGMGLLGLAGLVVKRRSRKSS
ncbi:TPA: LPXTG cell wall anchor domain-containing protein [Streptococcus suis]|nr:LPXTG cell wall anchor domain-containing protein [Streptococcus suis]HEM3676679.1 LPXTG cell wall anchor domain-containing protein [Streptococcus suis]